MALIPWIIKGNNRSVVTKEADFNPKRKAVRVVDFNPMQFKKGDSPNASYDLHVGDKYRRYRDPDAKSIDGGVVKLTPGEGVIIQTKEQVHFPNSVFGLILPKEGLLRKGLGNTPTKVDPGYGLGRLHITVFNHSTKTVTLEHLTPFCTLCLFEVREDVVPYNGSKDLRGEPERPRGAGGLRWLAANWVYLLLALGAFGGLILGIINRIMPVMPK